MIVSIYAVFFVVLCACFETLKCFDRIQSTKFAFYILLSLAVAVRRYVVDMHQYIGRVDISPEQHVGQHFGQHFGHFWRGGVAAGRSQRGQRGQHGQHGDSVDDGGDTVDRAQHLGCRGAQLQQTPAHFLSSGDSFLSNRLTLQEPLQEPFK
jgi:hypothetical protein